MYLIGSRSSILTFLQLLFMKLDC